MTFLKNLTIKKKLTFILMFTSITAVSLACVVFMIFSFYTYRQLYLHDLTGLARIVGNNCAASLAFDIPEDAKKILSGLDARPSVRHACLYKQNGEVFAVFNRTGESKADHEIAGHKIPNHKIKDIDLTGYGKEGHVFTGNFLTVFHQIHLGNDFIGVIHLRDDMSEIFASLKRDIAVLVLVMSIAMVAAYFISSGLQSIISKPILMLSDVTATVSFKKDYSIRAEKQNNDEVGMLIDSFNDMLAQIQQRDDALRESEKRFKTLVEHGTDAFFLHDTNGKLVDVNQRACLSLGYTKEELLSMRVLDIDVSFASNSIIKEQVWDKLIGDKTMNVEGRQKRKDGTTFPVDISAGCLELDDRKYIQVLARDITERKKAEEELAKHREHLEELVNERTKDLEDAQQELIKSEKLSVLGRLTATVSHELRNPLAVIQSSAFFLGRKLKGYDEKTGKHIDRIEQQVGICDSIVNELLEYTRGKKSEVAPGDFNHLIEDILSQIEELESVLVKCELSPEPIVIPFDTKKIRRIVINLVNNAIQATKAQSQIMQKEAEPYQPMINVKTSLVTNGVCVEVEDNGGGMDDKTLNQAFEPLFTTRARGTGLGLAIVEKVVEEHNGSVSISSTIGQGTKVSFVIPKSGNHKQHVKTNENMRAAKV